MRVGKTAQVCGLLEGVVRGLDRGYGDGGRWRIVANVVVEDRCWTGGEWEEYGRGMGRECEWMTVGKNGVKSSFSFLSSPPM